MVLKSLLFSLHHLAPSRGHLSLKSIEETFFFLLLGLHVQRMEVSRLGVKLDLQPLAYTTAHSNARSPTP